MADINTLHPDMRARVANVLNDPVARKHGLHIVSAGRTTEHQARLRRQAEANCRRDRRKCPPGKWVAAVGTSNHEMRFPARDNKKYAKAVDFGVRGVRSVNGQWPAHVMEWYLPLLRKYGLYLRMPWEDWHAEPIENWDDDGIPPMPRIRPVLYLNMKGEDVRFLQYCLKQLGFNITVDGKYGAATRQTVIDFQKWLGIKGAGRVGKQTWDAINYLLKNR